MKQFLILCSALLLLTACTNSPTVQNIAEKKPSLDLAAAKKAVEDGQQIFMDLFKKGDSLGVANVYTVDAKVMNAGSPAAEGRDNIIKFFGKIFRSGSKIITVKTIGAWNSADMIVEEGKWIMADKDGNEYDHGKYLILWKMEDDQWKKFRDCHNSDIYPLSK
jgi:ketosteroid isomerase-like protein